MARNWPGIPFASLPKLDTPEAQRRVRDMLATIDEWARDVSFGLGRINRGEAPDGTGTPIGGGVTDHGDLTGLGDDDHLQYLLLQGRAAADQIVRPFNATRVGLTVRGASGGTDIFRVQDENGITNYISTDVNGVTTFRAGTVPIVTIPCLGIGMTVGGPGGTSFQLQFWGTSTETRIMTTGSTFYLCSSTGLGVALTTLYLAGGVFCDCGSSTVLIPLVVRGSTSHSLNLQEWRTGSPGTVWAYVTKDGYLGTRRVELNGSTSGTLSFQTAAATTSHTLTMPAAQGGAGTFLKNDGAGALSWGTSSLAAVNLTGQTASIGSTTLLTGSASTAGMYRVSAYLKTTTAGNPADVVKMTVQWNDGAAQTEDVPFLSATVIFNNLDLATLNAFAAGSIVVNAAASQNITFTSTVTKTGSPQYELHARIEPLG